MKDLERKLYAYLLTGDFPTSREGGFPFAVAQSPARRAAQAVNLPGPDSSTGDMFLTGSVKNYDPTLRDKMALWLMGDEKPSPMRRRMVGDLMGSSGLGNEGMSLVDLSGAGLPLAAEETGRAIGEGDYGGAAISALGMVPGAAVAGGAKLLGKGLKAMSREAAEAGAGALARTRETDATHLAMRNPSEVYPPDMPQRPFSKDYHLGRASTDAAGRLLEDRFGLPLTAPYVAGRTHMNGPDMPVGPRITTGGTGANDTKGSLEELIKEFTGKRSRIADPGELDDDASGLMRRNLTTGAPDEIVLHPDTHPDDHVRVLAHELGHAIDNHIGFPDLPDGRIREQMEGNYDRLLPDWWGVKRPYTPEKIGYEPHHADGELMAEAFAAYLLNPNFFKETAPDVADYLAGFNQHPALRDTLQFNMIPLLAGSSALFAPRMFAPEDEAQAQGGPAPLRPGF